MTARNFQVATLAIYALSAGVLLAVLLNFCGGHFVYTLDDPYIHLAVAENIARGGYGINFPEYSSPSSSILFPFLLAPFALLQIDRFAPLAIGLACNAAALWIMAGFFHQHVIARGSDARDWAWVLIAPLLILAVNGIALPFVGMEHPLHLLAVVVTITGLVVFGETGRISPALIVAVVLAPLIRFEGLALSGATLLVLFLAGRIKVAIATGAVIAGCLAAYAVFMHRHGLPPLPSSVMVKSGASAAAMELGSSGLIRGVIGNAVESQTVRGGTLLAAGIVLLFPAIAGFRLGRNPVLAPSTDTLDGARPMPTPYARAIVAVPAICALAAHILLGTYGWFGRYEVYVLGILLLSLTYVASDAIRRMEGAAIRRATCGLALILLSIPFLKTTWNTPAAARSIYQQQIQMHRFITEYFPHDVAVNDIGAVSYRNDRYVLDLWGLGSEEARKLYVSGRQTPATLDAIVRHHHVPLVMIYDNWFAGSIPQRWEPVARLQTSTVLSGMRVTFYATDPSRRDELIAAIARFAPTLPPGARITRADASVPARTAPVAFTPPS